MIAPLRLIPRVRGERQERDQFGDATHRVDQENARRMMTRGQVIVEVTDHGIPIEGNQYSSRVFGPQEDRWVIGAERQIGWIADANDIDRISASEVVALNGPPERPTQVLVEE